MCDSLKYISLVNFSRQVWNVAKNSDVKKAIEIGKYVRHLPVDLIDQIFAWLVTDNLGLSTSHVAVVIHQQCRQLIIDDDVNSPDFEFDVNFLLDVSGDLLHELTELKLPVGCRLNQNMTHRLAKFLPNLQILNLYCVNIRDDCMKEITCLNLTELNLSYTPISDIGLNNLCQSSSNLNSSLKVLHTYGSRTTPNGHFPVLKVFTKLEDIRMSVSTSTLLANLPANMRDKLYSLKRIRQFPPDNYPKTKIGLEVAVKCCPNITQIKLSLRDPNSVEVLDTLSKFENLTKLSVSINFTTELSFMEFFSVLKQISKRLTKFKLSGFKSFSVNEGIEELDFSNLIKLTLKGCITHPITIAVIYSIICNAYNLQQLKIEKCYEFNDDFVTKITERNLLTKLRMLSLKYCTDLGLNGASCLLKSPFLSHFSLISCLDEEASEKLKDIYEQLGLDCHLSTIKR